jgi:hypothetical protein
MTPSDFMKEEYLSLRKEVENAVTQLATLERNCILAVALTYAWLVTAKLEDSLSFIAWSIPVLLSVFGGLRSFSIGQHLRRLSTYIQKIELEVCQGNEFAKGWEHHHTAETDKKKIRTAITFLFWAALIAITISVALTRNVR